MSRKYPLYIATVVAGLLLSLPTAQAQSSHGAMEHGGHGDGYGVKPSAGKLPALNNMPESGKAREAGFDGRSLMESTRIHADLATKCAQAQRGLIHLDNAAWKKCGGKPAGLVFEPETRPRPAAEHPAHGAKDH